MTVRDYSTTPANNNSAPPNGWPEGQAASTINDCGRQMQADIRESFEDLPYFDYGDDPTRVDNDTFTVSGDLTTRYPVGARIKLVGATSGFARITASSHAAGTTTIDVIMDSGNVPTSLVRVGVKTDLGSASTPTSVSLSASAAGSIAAYAREDHVHVLSQTIAPTMTATWTFTKAGGVPANAAIYLSSTAPEIVIRQSDAAADNKIWDNLAFGEALIFRTVNDAENAVGVWLQVERTGVTVDSVAHPTDGSGGIGGIHRFGTNNSSSGLSSCLMQVRTTTAQPTAVIRNATTGQACIACHNEATSSDNVFALFGTEAGFTTRGSITYNRAGGLTAFNTTSRRELKRNIRDAGSAISKLLEIKIRAFDWVEPEGAKLDWWAVADELEAVCPWAADPDGVNPAALVFLAIKGLQEQQAMIAQLQTRLSALEARSSAVRT